MTTQPIQPTTPAPAPPLDGAPVYTTPFVPLAGGPSRGDTPGPDPFMSEFANHKGDRVQVAAGGPFAETLRAIGHETAPLALSAAKEAVDKQSEVLTRLGHTGELPTHAININLDRIDDPQQINGLIDAVAQTLAGPVDEARRGTRSNAVTTAAAQELFRQDEGFMLRRGVGEAYNAEQITATRMVMASARDKTMQFAQAIIAGQTDQASLIGFKRGLSQMAAIQLQLHGMAAEAGRALGSMRHMVQPGVLQLADEAQKLYTLDAKQLPESAGTLGTAPPAVSPTAAAATPTSAAAPTAPAAGAPPNAAPASAQPVPATLQPQSGGATIDIQAFLDANGGIDNVIELANRFVNLPSDAERNAVARGSVDRGFAEMLGEVWYNFVLSGPATHFVNMTGNAITLGTETGERAIAAKWGKLFGFISKEGTEGVKAGEAAALTQAYWGAMHDAWKLAVYAFRHGESAGKATGYRMPLSTLDILRMSPQDAAAMAGSDPAAAATSKLSTGKGPAITGQNMANAATNAINAASRHVLDRNVMDPVLLGERGVLGRFTDFLSGTVDVAGIALRTPTRLLGAEDQFWKTLAYRGEQSARAWREGINSGLSGKNLEDYVDQMVNFTTEAGGYDRAAEAFAKKVTMQEDLQIGILKHMQMAGASKLGFLFAPFVRVSVNILDYSTARMAFPLRPSWIADVTSRDPAVRDMAMARASTGAVMWMGAFGAASTGQDADNDAPIMVTGAGPIDPQEKAVWLKAGNKDYSVRLGGRKGKWYSYSRLDPAGQMLGIAADSINIMTLLQDDATKSEFAAALVAGIGNNLVNKSYMRTIADGMEVFTSYDPNQWLKWVQGQVAGMAVPNLVTQYVASQDPYLRKAVGVAEEIAKRSSVEGRRKLPLERDLAGEPIKQEWLFGTRFTGIAVEDSKPDAVAEEVMRLRMDFHKPPGAIRGVKLTPAQYSRYQQLVGHGLKMPHNDPQSTYYSPAIGPKFALFKLDMEGKGMWEVLGELVRNPTYKLGTDGGDPPGQKADMIADIRSRYIEAAQLRMMVEYPKIAEDALAVEKNTTMAKGTDPHIVDAVGKASRDSLMFQLNRAKDYEVVSE